MLVDVRAGSETRLRGLGSVVRCTSLRMAPLPVGASCPDAAVASRGCE